jgi:hypothetical protein
LLFCISFALGAPHPLRQLDTRERAHAERDGPHHAPVHLAQVWAHRTRQRLERLAFQAARGEHLCTLGELRLEAGRRRPPGLHLGAKRGVGQADGEADSLRRDDEERHLNRQRHHDGRNRRTAVLRQ